MQSQIGAEHDVKEGLLQSCLRKCDQSHRRRSAERWRWWARIWFSAILGLGAGLIAVRAEAPKLDLTWNPNPEPDIAGYRVYFGFAPREYVSTNDVPGLETEVSLALPLGGVTYFLAVTAYNESGIESEFSDEIEFAAPADGRIVDTLQLPQVVMVEDTVATLSGLDLPTTWMRFLGPYHGALRGPTTELEYVPAPDFNGIDAFEFLAMSGDSAVARVSGEVRVDGINDAPVAYGEDWRVDVGGSYEAVLQAEDVDGTQLSYQIIRLPTSGTLITDSLPDVVYQPFDGFRGTDSFGFTVSDGELESNEAEIRIRVASPGGPPVVEDQEIRIPEDSATPVELRAMDPDNGPVTFVVVSPPKYGVLNGDPPIFVYVPDPDFSGGDGFSFVAVDEDGLEAEGVISIEVVPVNDLPAVRDMRLWAVDALPTLIQLSAVDDDGDPVTLEIVDGPASGELVPPQLLQGMSEVAYLPALPTGGTDAFTYRAGDGIGWSRSAMVRMVVLSSDEAAPQVRTEMPESRRLVLRWPALIGGEYVVSFRRAEPEATWEQVGPSLIGGGEEIQWMTDIPPDCVGGFFRVALIQVVTEAASALSEVAAP